MGKLLEGFTIICMEFDHILKKGGKLFKGGYHQREDTNAVDFGLKVTRFKGNFDVF